MRIWLVALLVLIAGPALAADPLTRIVIRPEFNDPPYDQVLYRLWVDADGDHEDARAEVLAAESLFEVTWRTKPTGEREVAFGLWVDPYSGFYSTDPSDFDIDHLVPLAEAHESRGHAWSAERKEAYANDLQPRTLIVVRDRLNQSKGHQDPAEWMPPNRAYWCTYLQDWIAVKRAWALGMDAAEAVAIRKGLKQCEQRG